MVVSNAASRCVDGGKNHLTLQGKSQVIILISLLSLTTFPLGALGGGGAPDIQQFQQGTTSCNIPAGSFPPICNVILTFPTAFTSIPNHAEAHLIGTNSSVAHSENCCVPVGSVSFQADNGLTWTSMPVALTEIYGTTNHETAFNGGMGFGFSAELTVLCPTASNSATAVLRPQYSTDGSTWFDLIASQQGDVPVGNASACVLGVASTPSGGAFPFVSGALNTPIFLRVVGLNGGGVGDNPVFSNIQLELFARVFQTVSFCIPTVAFAGGTTCNTTGSGSFCSTLLSKTTMCINAWTAFPTFSDYRVYVQWTARLCINGGSAC